MGNCTELIVAILLLTKCQISVVQASLLGGLLSNLLLVLGMAFTIGGIRFSEQEFKQTAAQLNTSVSHSHLGFGHLGLTLLSVDDLGCVFFDHALHLCLCSGAISQ